MFMTLIINMCTNVHTRVYVCIYLYIFVCMYMYIIYIGRLVTRMFQNKQVGNWKFSMRPRSIISSTQPRWELRDDVSLRAYLILIRKSSELWNFIIHTCERWFGVLACHFVLENLCLYTGRQDWPDLELGTHRNFQTTRPRPEESWKYKSMMHYTLLV